MLHVSVSPSAEIRSVIETPRKSAVFSMAFGHKESWQTMDQPLRDYSVFGRGAMKPVVNSAQFFCLTFAFITPNLLMYYHVCGF
ncbi:MAG: hypothetical protein ACI9KS_002467 [Sulfitobacter sp.]|jgi:hypothetical protein